MKKNTSFSLSVGISLLALVVSLGVISWVNGLQYIS